MINIIGTIFGITGYDSHTRQLANALSKYTDVRLEVSLPANWEKEATDKELSMIKKKPSNDINLIITNPTNWKLYTTAKRNWAFLVWEGDKIPLSFIEECLNPDIEYIFVPSEHTKSALLNTTDTAEEYDEVINKIKVIPHGVDLEKFYPRKGVYIEAAAPLTTEGIKEVVNHEESFKFLCNKGLRNLQDRGGVQYLIKAYLEEFTDKDNVELIVKINPAYGVPNLLEMFPEIGKESTPKVIYVTDNIRYDKLVELYNQCDVFVSSTRAEAYNLPCIEAMACGKPVITTNFGGQTDFCTDKTGWIIGGELTEIKHEIQYEGIKWLTPDIKKLRVTLRDAFTRDLTKKSEEALSCARKNTWDHTANKIIEFI